MSSLVRSGCYYHTFFFFSAEAKTCHKSFKVVKVSHKPRTVSCIKNTEEKKTFYRRFNVSTSDEVRLYRERPLPRLPSLQKLLSSSTVSPSFPKPHKRRVRQQRLPQPSRPPLSLHRFLFGSRIGRQTRAIPQIPLPLPPCPSPILTLTLKLKLTLTTPLLQVLEERFPRATTLRRRRYKSRSTRSPPQPCL